MILKALEIQGFKSFPDKTRLDFDRGLTAVVGPNGSGKSNISDAVRWVLGEQSSKTLRGEKMEDVIFNGTEARKAQGFAQVSLHIDNSDHGLQVDSDEVTVTRKYYRSGESEYLINGSNVRLKDLNELFMDTGLGKTGYSMIGQGRIAEIVGAKSTERREIFEEASGISKFRYRKNESERRLKQAEENLLRLRDILTELEDRVGPLKAQSEKAKQYLSYAEKRRILEVSLWVDKLNKSTQLMRAHLDKLTLCKNDYERVETQANDLEAQTGEVYKQMQDCLVRADELRRAQEQAKTDAGARSARAAICENDVTHHRAEIERLQSAIDASAGSDAALGDAEAARREQLAETERALEAIERETLQKQEALLNLTAQTDRQTDRQKALSDRLNRLTLGITELKMQILSAQNTIDGLQTRMDGIAETNKTREAALQTAKQEQQEIAEGLETLEEKNAALVNTRGGYDLKLSARREKLEAVQKQYSELDMQIREKLQKAQLLSDLESNMEGFAYSVKTVVKAGKSGALRGILGTVSQLLSVDRKYAVAVETALGGAMQHILVENESAAKSAIQLLKTQKAGRATFLPITSVKGNRLQESGLDAVDGYIALACDLVQTDARYSGIVTSLLGRTVVADDLDTAIVLAKRYKYRFKIVTLDGQVVNAGGSFTGGSQNKTQGVLSRKNDVAALRAQAAALESKRDALRAQLEALKSETAELDAQVVAVNSERIVLSEDRIRFEGEKKRVDHIVGEMRASIDAALDELDAAALEQKRQTDAIQAAEEKLRASERELAEQQTELAKLDGSKSSLESERQTLSEAISELRIKRMELQKDVAAAETALLTLAAQRADADAQRKTLLAQKCELEDRVAALQSEIDGLRTDAENLLGQAESFAQEITAVMEARNRLESSTTEIRREQKAVQDTREGLARELAKLEERKASMERDVETLTNRMWEEYGLSRSEADEVAVRLDNLVTAQKELNELKAKIKALGSVNVDAIEEYKVVSERYEFLSAQIRDAEQSREELMRLIRDLTARMETIFTESFQQINQQFGRIFKELFGGGKASLILLDPQNVLDCGIEIQVQPPGKIINNLSSLSGGEQAFVAIAIYFAILKVRPAPFCILDEIEAALDEANVVKYARYLRTICDRTQFILITHRRGSMEESDVLYGVTMQEKGVSKLLKLDITEIEDRLGLKQG